MAASTERKLRIPPGADYHTLRASEIRDARDRADEYRARTNAEELYSNRRRADMAVLALLTVTDFDAISDTELETYLADLYAHMRHLARLERVNWDEVMRRGDTHFETEIQLQGRRGANANTD